MKKFKYVVLFLIVTAVIAFIYLSLTPNTLDSKFIKNKMAKTNSKGDIGSPNNGKKPPIPPPPPKFDSNQPPAPAGYKKFTLIEAPPTIVNVAPGEMKKVSIKADAGSIPLQYSWKLRNKDRRFQEISDESSIIINLGDENQAFYKVTVSDGINEKSKVFKAVRSGEGQADPQPIAEKVNNESPPVEEPKLETQNLDAPKPSAQKVDVAEVEKPDELPEKLEAIDPPPVKAPTEKNVEKVAAKPKPPIVKKPDPKPVAEQPKPKVKKEAILPDKKLAQNLKAGRGLSLSYTINMKKPYSISWYHRPPGSKKAFLLKRKKTNKFSLKRLNKNHRGKFFIKVKNASGTKTSPAYSINVK